MPTDSLAVEHLFTLEADTVSTPPAFIANGPQGTRLVVTVTGGTFKGERLSGTIANTAGGDWVTLRQDGTLKLDVRLTLQTDDGAMILMTYSGVGVTDAAGTTNVRTAPLFETGDERYTWLNGVQAVAVGQTTPAGVTYDVYALK